MKVFFDNNLFLESCSAKEIYDAVKSLPIIDYHCHLDVGKIAMGAGFEDVGQLWLAEDHYKWRAMRLCGVDEKYITGDGNFHDKFIEYGKIMPKLVGNPLYYWTQLELKMIFGINEALNESNAERIYQEANKRLADISVPDILKQFNVEYIASTDDPTDSLSLHGKYGNTRVAPTFRPDKIFNFDDEYINILADVSGIKIETLDDLQVALERRLDFFVSKGCRISDHGFAAFPKEYADYEEAKRLFQKRKMLTQEQKDKLFGYVLLWLTGKYYERDMIMQIHFAVVRNNNPQMFEKCGADSGFDLIGKEQDVNDLISFLAKTPDNKRPQTVLYTLNDNNLSAIVCATGAFRNVKAGAAWWFNDTVRGIYKNLETIAEYGVLGTNFGMLTDSRSFSSYVRFDFFRRLLSNYMGRLVENGEYDIDIAKSISQDICYYNIKGALKI